VRPQPPNAIKVFCSYSHVDEPLRKELEKHIKILERQGLMAVWHDRKIGAGEEWKEEIDEQLESADVILLLITPDFIASDYCYDLEMGRAMERHDAGDACVIPVFLRPVNWKGAPFGKLQALPTDAKPVSLWQNQDEAFVIVSEGIQRAVENLGARRQTTTATTAGKPQASAPIPRPPVVGFVARRDAEGHNIVERLQEELAPQGNRLVTLSGPGGIGKTTLAAEAARALKEVFGGHIVWSKAEGRADFALSMLLDDISTQLGREDLRTLAPDLKAAQVRELIAYPPVLIVLDNYETIAPEAKKGIEEWFASTQCSALLTSRHGISWTRNIPIAAMSREEAQEYMEKLIAQTQDSQIFSNEVRQRIYETAEANPYVMQWVVAQIGAAQEPRTVLEELAQGDGDAATRVFGRSFNLEQLGDDGRSVLLALSLFVPSATRNALAAVAGFGDDLKRVNEAVKNLRALWLIKGLGENRRFTIEGLTRSLARARLLKDERADEFRQRFVAHFLNYAKAHTQTTRDDFDALEAEKDNALSAMDAAFDLKDWASVIRTRFALTEFLDLRGYWDEGIRSGQQALAAARYSQNESSVAAWAHNLAIMHHSRGELESAQRLYNESLEIKKRLGNQRGIASTLHQLGTLAQDEGEIEEARRLFNESLEIAKRLGHQKGIAIILHHLGMLAQDEGKVEEARRLYNESLEIEKRFGDESGIATTLHELGRLAQAQGKVEEARRLYNESLEIKKKLGDQSGIADTLNGLAVIVQAQGEVEEARRLFNESLEIEKRLGNQSGIAITLHNLGRLAEDENNSVEAARLFREALGIFERLKSPYAEIARRSLERVETEAS
jgi:tetratricopeptide (TPR) repeat protein